MQQLDWDYTELADAYVKRPGYAPEAIDELFSATALGPGSAAIDLGAGTGHLARMLGEGGWNVVALEPNPAMHAHGIHHTRHLPNVRWVSGVMEATGQDTAEFSACTFGSSFGVADHGVTLNEAARIVKPGGWLACIFNHRDLSHPLQAAIEAHIKSCLPRYLHGPRRDDQQAAIEGTGRFALTHRFEARMTHCGPAAEWVEAWRSHATLQRQAGAAFADIVDGIADIVSRQCSGTVAVPYFTRLWVARRRG